MIMKTIKALWIGAAVFVLYVTIDGFYNTRDNDVWDVLAWLMLILSFPAGLVVSLVLWALGGFSIIGKTSYLSLALAWAGYFVLGYIQWLKFTPYLIAKLRALKNQINSKKSKQESIGSDSDSIDI